MIYFEKIKAVFIIHNESDAKSKIFWIDYIYFKMF